mmetsp:Transcript_2552/g.8395  ORF Transcript_2552/g.8395 Transcript_2552/m.8395 type:complete len:225 (+) Transcript_2552:1946-2620(+)
MRRHCSSRAVEGSDEVDAHPVVEGIEKHVHECQHHVLCWCHLSHKHSERDQCRQSSVHAIDDVLETERKTESVEVVMACNQQCLSCNKGHVGDQSLVSRHLVPHSAVTALPQLSHAEVILNFHRRDLDLTLVLVVLQSQPCKDGIGDRKLWTCEQTLEKNAMNSIHELHHHGSKLNRYAGSEECKSGRRIGELPQKGERPGHCQEDKERNLNERGVILLEFELR